MSAQEELEKLEREIRTSLSTYVIPLGAWADRLAEIREGLGKAQGEAQAYLTDEGSLLPVCFANEYRDRGARLIPLYASAHPADSAPSLEGIRVSLCAPTASEPFRRLECSIVDIGHADRALVVECKELVGENKALHACLDGSERANQMYAKSAYDCMASAQVLVDALEKIANYGGCNCGAPCDCYSTEDVMRIGRIASNALAAHKSEVKG